MCGLVGVQFGWECSPTTLGSITTSYTFLPQSICEPANSSKVKQHQVATSSNEVNIAPMTVGAGPRNVVKVSGMSGGKRLVSLSPPKPRISSNLDGRQSGPSRAVRNKPDDAAGATSTSDKPPATRMKT